MSDSDLSGRIMALLTPLVGQNMARAAIIAHCARNGLDPTNLRGEDLPVLARGIGMALVCFVGKARAEQVSFAIRTLIPPR